MSIGNYTKGDHVLVLDLDLPSWVMCTVESISWNPELGMTMVAHAWPPIIGPKNLPVVYAISSRDVSAAVRPVDGQE